MVRKKKPPEQVKHERWLVSYADFITLLFAFFTTMYAISTVDAQKMGKMVMAMKSSFDSGIFKPSSDKMPLIEGAGGAGATPAVQRLVENIRSQPKPAYPPTGAQRGLGSGASGLDVIRRNVESLVGSEALQGRVRMRMDGRGLIISLGEGGFFDSGSEIIKPAGKILLDAIGTGLAKADNYIRVEGHTDHVPIRSLKFPSNWELSTARATAVIVHLITKFGLPPARLSGAGYAEFHPVASNDTEEGRARNRRIDILVLDPRFASLEPR